MRNLKLPAAVAAFCLWSPAAGADVSGTYFAVIVDDLEVSAEWYGSVFGLEVGNRMSEADRYDIAILVNDSLVVELLELAAAADRPDGMVRGPFKTGFLVDDLEAFAAALPDHVPSPDILDDEANDLLLLQLRDPDGYIVQVMQRKSPALR